MWVARKQGDISSMVSRVFANNMGTQSSTAPPTQHRSHLSRDIFYAWPAALTTKDLYTANKHQATIQGGAISY